MDFIIDTYKVLYETEKKLFKELLNDFLLISEEIKKNKGKKTINYHEIEKLNYKFLNETEEYIKQKGIDDEDIKKLTNDYLYNKLFGVGLNCGYENIPLNVYKGKEENNINDNIYFFRRSFITLLEENNIIKIANFNLIEGIKELEEKEFFGEKFKEIKNILSIKFGKKIIDRQFEFLEGKEKYLEFISYKKETIQALLKEIEKIDSKEITYENHTLYYNGLYYPLKKDSQRDLFVKLFFSSNKKSYSKKEIIDNLENFSGNFYDEKYRKKILDLYRALNKTIEKKLGIKNLFELGKGLDKDIIYIKG